MINFIIILGILGLNSVTDMPIVNAVVYGLVILLLRLMFGVDFVHALISSMILAAIAAGLFWLLKKLQNSILLLWVGSLILSFIGLMIISQLV